MALDLPAELWLEILTYFPNGFVRTMAGVSRTCYELAMNDIYKELELVSTDECTLQRIQLVSQPAFAQRVHKLNIRSSFLPTEEMTLQNHRQGPESLRHVWGALGRLLANTNTRLEIRNERATQDTHSRKFDSGQASEDALKTLAAAFPHFIHLQEVSVLLHEFPVASYLYDFLGQLWLTRASGIRTFKLDTALVKIPLILDPLLKSRVPFPNLESLSLSLMTSRCDPLQCHRDFCRTITSFIASHRKTLQTLIISEPPLLDLSPLFRDLGHLPYLKRLELPIYMVETSLSQIASLQAFLSHNSGKLERLLLRQKPTCFGPALDRTYWRLISEVLPSLSFPMLSELDLDCAERPHNEPSRPVPVFPPRFRSFGPKLKSLTLDSPDWMLSYSELKELLRNLSANSFTLEFLCVPLEILSPVHMDEIAIQLPCLQALEITYTTLGLLPTEAQSITRRSVRPAVQSVRDKFLARRYKQWSLKYLRVSRRSDCGEGHPVAYVNKIIASSIPGLETLNNTRTCFCRTTDFHNIMQWGRTF